MYFVVNYPFNTQSRENVNQFLNSGDDVSQENKLASKCKTGEKMTNQEAIWKWQPR